MTCDFQIGADIYAKATFVIFVIVTTALASIFGSFFTVDPRMVMLPDTSFMNASTQITANYTGLRVHTLEGNLWGVSVWPNVDHNNSL